MSKIYIISETLDIIEELAKLILKENLELNDFSKILVISPGKRPASYLYNYLGEKIKEKTKVAESFFPPKILSMDEFINYILSESEFSDYTEMSKIDALYFLYKIHEDNIEFEKFISYGERLLKFIDELDYEFDEDLNIEDKKFSSDIKEKLLNVIKIRKKFHEKLKTDKKFVKEFNGFKYFCAEEVIKNNLKILENYKKIYFLGIYGITNIERKIIKKIIDNKDVILLWQGIDDYEFLQKQKEFFNIEIENINGEKQKNQNIEIFSAQNSFMQFIKVREILENLKDNIKNSCIIFPDEKSLIPSLSFINLNNINYNIGLKFDIKNTVQYSLIESLIECVLSVKKLDKKFFLNSKKYLNIITNLNIHIDILSKFPFVEIDDISLELKKLKTIKNKDEIKKIEKINETIKNLLLNSDPIEEIKSLIEYLKDKDTNFIFTHIIKELKKIKNYKVFNEIFSNTTRLKIILNEIKNIKIEYKTKSPADLEILSPLETQNLKFKNLIIIDAQEGILPPGKRIMPLFQKFVYENLDNDFYIYAYNDDKYVYYFYRYEFYRLLKAAENIYFIYVENYKTTRSRYIEKLIFDREKKENKIDALKPTKLLIDLNLTQNNKIEIKKNKKIIEKLQNLEFSSTLIEDFLRDQIEFFYKYVIGIEEEKIKKGLEPPDIGDIIHRALGCAYKNYINIEINAKNANEIYKEIYKNLEKFLDNEEQKFPYGAFFMFKEIALRKLKKYIEKEKNEIIKNNEMFKILEIEKSINIDYKLNEKIIKFVGRIDRIDYFPNDDKYVLIDYKTGKVIQNELNLDLLNSFESIRNSKINFQFPIYVFLFHKKYNINFEKIYTKFVSFDYEDNKIENYNEEKIKKYLKILNIVIEEILNPEIPFREY